LLWDDVTEDVGDAVPGDAGAVAWPPTPNGFDVPITLPPASSAWTSNAAKLPWTGTRVSKPDFAAWATTTCS